MPTELYSSSAPVAVRTPNLALVDLCQNCSPCQLAFEHVCDVVSLGTRILVVEVKYHRIGFAAVHAGMAREVLQNPLLRMLANSLVAYRRLSNVVACIARVVFTHVGPAANSAIGLSHATGAFLEVELIKWLRGSTAWTGLHGSIVSHDAFGTPRSSEDQRVDLGSFSSHAGSTTISSPRSVGPAAPTGSSMVGPLPTKSGPRRHGLIACRTCVT